MFTLIFWKATAERAIKSAAQGAAAVWSVATFTSLDVVTNTAEAAGLGALAAGVLSVLMSLGSSALTDGGPSLTNSEVLPPATGGE